MSDKDMAICRIDYMKWSDMQQIHKLVSSVRVYANTYVEVEDHIRQVTEQIEDVFEGRVGSNEYTAIVRLLKELVLFVRTHWTVENDNEVIVVTGKIIKLVQGDNKMDKNQLVAMTFRRVQKAIQEVVRNGVDFTDDRIADVADEYAAKIVTDVFGGKIPFEIQSSQFVDKYYEMDPETEDLLDNGTLVVDGMEVLVESPSLREEIHDRMSAADISKARMKNRWATVENSKIRDGILSFVALYEDGIKRKVVQQSDLAWLVKKDSIPMIAEDVSAGTGEKDHINYVVWNKGGIPVFVGTISAVLDWVAELPEVFDWHVGFEVSPEDVRATVSLKEFVEENNG